MGKKAKVLILLHIILMVYSVTGIFSKSASAEDFLSLRWCLYYAGVIFLLGLYALGWQQVIKRMPLTAAYANKAVTTIWGLIWGVIFFGEQVTVGKVIGIVIIVIGVIIYSLSDSPDESEGV